MSTDATALCGRQSLSKIPCSENSSDITPLLERVFDFWVYGVGEVVASHPSLE